VSERDLYLGKLKRFRGASDYAIPEGTPLEEFTHVVLWRRKASEAVGLAQISGPSMAGDGGMQGDGMGKGESMDAMGGDGMAKDEDGMSKDEMDQGDMDESMKKDAMDRP
jgi:hypothetical protein